MAEDAPSTAGQPQGQAAVPPPFPPSPPSPPSPPAPPAVPSPAADEPDVAPGEPVDIEAARAAAKANTEEDPTAPVRSNVFPGEDLTADAPPPSEE